MRHSGEGIGGKRQRVKIDITQWEKTFPKKSLISWCTNYTGVLYLRIRISLTDIQFQIIMYKTIKCFDIGILSSQAARCVGGGITS